MGRTCAASAPTCSSSASTSTACPKGGWLDGALGVMAGLELLRSLAADGTPPVHRGPRRLGRRGGRPVQSQPVRLGGGRRHARPRRPARARPTGRATGSPTCWPSTASTSRTSTAPRTRIGQREGVRRGAHRARTGARATRVWASARSPAPTGIERERLIFRGQAAHAGTMPMEMRRDSFRAAGSLRARARRDRRRATTASRPWAAPQCWPGVVTAVPGETRITMDMRHIDADALAAMFAEANDAAHRAADGGGLHGRLEHIFRIPPMPFHPACSTRPAPRARGRGPRRRAAVAARCTTPARWPARSRP